MNVNECFHCKNSDSRIRSFPWSYRPKAKYNDQPRETEIEISFCDSCYPYVKYAHFYGWDWWDAVDGVSLYFEFKTCHLCGDEHKGLPRQLPFDDRHSFDYPFFCDPCFQRLAIDEKTKEEQEKESLLPSLSSCINDALDNGDNLYHRYESSDKTHQLAFIVKRMGKHLVRLSNVRYDKLTSAPRQIAIFHLEKKQFIKRLWVGGDDGNGDYLDNLVTI